tara:strand:+ start:577 stop:1593 length:1017 start_codon:yes stop_codon:yes gene_type:complete
MFIINHKKIFFAIAAVVVALSITAIATFGLNQGIDFSGGTLLEIEYTDEKPSNVVLREDLQQAGYSDLTLQSIGELGLLLKIRELSDEEKDQIDALLTVDSQYQFTEIRYRNIGPTISGELQNKSLFAIFLVVVAIVLFVAYVFREVSVPVSSWKYGFVAIVALVHDILVPTAVFAFLGSFLIEYQIDVLFITALLAILGFSVNDTIVVFDRIRENLRQEIDKVAPAKKTQEEKRAEIYRGEVGKEDKATKVYISDQRFKEIVGLSLNQTFVRSFNTSLTTLVVLLMLFFVGGETTKPFALTLAIGVLAGTYSSLFLASPLLTYLAQTRKSHERSETA